MTDRLNQLPPQLRSFIARQVQERNGRGVVATTSVLKAVRALCPNAIPTRELEDAIAEEAVLAGLAVDFSVDEHRSEKD